MGDQLAFIKTIQPYFVMETSRFNQYVIGQYGISHFYSYETDQESLGGAVVPDGCIDIIFEYGQNSLQANVCGTVLKHKMIARQMPKTYFGIRFFPGFCPSLIHGRLKDFVDCEIPFSEISKSVYLFAKMSEAHTFTERICVFMEEYMKTYEVKEANSNMKRILKTVEAMIYRTNGEIRIKDMEERTGYTERYINKLFHAELGMNPKKFCLIIKFQRFLTQLHCANGESIAKLAVDHGYCDQAYLIKEFAKYTNMTPQKYYRMIQDFGYNDRVVTFGDASPKIEVSGVF